MDLGLFNVSDTYQYVLNQSGANAITLGNGTAVNWNAGGVVALVGNQNINGTKTFSNNIGIGTNTPLSTLDVRGSITNYVGTAGNQTILQNWGWGNAIPRWKPVIESNANFAFYGYDSAGNSPAARITISNSDGNIGIGTSTPVSLLHVNGDILGSTIQSISNKSSHSQGAHLEWNKNIGDGKTYLLNNKGYGPGGIVFGEVDYTDNILVTGMQITSSGQVAFNYANTGAIINSTNLQMNRYPVIKGTVNTAATAITATVSPAGSKCTLIVSGSSLGSLAFVTPIRATGNLSVASTKVSTISFVSDGSFMYEIGRATSV